MSLLKSMTRHRMQLLRAVLFLIGATVCVNATAKLISGEPDYFNFFRQRVAASIALAIGLALLLGSVVPWTRLRSPAAWSADWSAQSQVPPILDDTLAGRNDPCPCGSGRKYKRCCLGKHQRQARQLRADQASATLNRSNAVSGGTHMANRGLSGR